MRTYAKSTEHADANSVFEEIWVVTVTYGDRFHLLRQTIEGALSSGAKRVLVVDNASVPDSYRALLDMEESSDGRMSVLRLEENRGSAGGYARGIRHAYEEGAEFIWLLDDDNYPAKDSLTKLLNAYIYLGFDEKNVLLSFRPARKEQRRAVYQGIPMGISSNTFLNFHIKELPYKIISKFYFNTSTIETKPQFPIIQIAHAPYGGLLLHRRWVELAGLPDERLFLYGDDHEYTERIVRSGGEIYLCASSVVIDLDESWNSSNKNIPPWVATNTNERHLYFAIRNRIWLEKTHVSSKFIYILNMLVYLFYLFLYMIIKRNPALTWQRMALILQAIRDGWRGDLGARGPKNLTH